MIDWTRPRTTRYEFEMVDPFDLDAVRGELTGVDPSASSLQWGYYMRLRATGALRVADSNYADNMLVRAWMVAEQGAGRERVELGTYFVDRGNMEYRRGRWTGDMALHSTLLRYEDDKLSGPELAGSGESALARFRAFARGAGGTVKEQPFIPDSAFGEAKWWDFGLPVRDPMQECAEAIGCRIGADSHGLTTLDVYESPSRREPSFDWPAGERSVTLVGLGLEDGAFGACNRFSARYESEGATLYAHADVPPSHFASFERCGRRITKTYDVDELSPPTVQRLQRIADGHRDDSINRARKWQVDSAYLPVETGQVVNFSYSDSPDGGEVRLRAMVQQIDMRLTPAASCKYILDEVIAQ